jgi:hypothetical protein
MAAKNKRRPTGYDLHNALALRQAGKTAQAKAAENNAKQWLRRMVILEGAAKQGKPQGGRAV